jgi:methyl-accepting chemotaxis protein
MADPNPLALPAKTTMSLAAASAAVHPQSPPARPQGGFFAHHGLWSPGVRLFRHIGFAAKATLISLVFMVPLATLGVQYFGTKAGEIAFSAKERLGVEYTQAVLPAIQQAQRQRMWTMRWNASGSEPAELAAVRQDLDRALAAIDAVQARLGAELGTADALAAVKAAQAKLPPASGDAEALWAAHGAFVESLIGLVTAAADGSNLTLDPEIDTYYLMDAATGSLPLLIETTGRMRGLSSAAAAAPASAALAHWKQRSFDADEALGDYMDTRFAGGIAKVVAIHPGLETGLDAGPALHAMHELHKKVEALAKGSEPRPAAPELTALGNTAVDGLFAVQRVTLAELDRLLLARLDRLEAARNRTATVIVLALALAVYLFLSFLRVMNGGLRQLQRHIGAISHNDLSLIPKARGNDEIAALLKDVALMRGNLVQVIGGIRQAADQVASASTQVAAGTADLAQRTEEAASNLQQSASAMEQMQSAVTSTADSSREAARLADENARLAQRGGETVGRAVQTMQSVAASSAKVGEIVGTIDSIAFQTNILALNAAVEAARAGEQGKGFAVVASEVRTLAQRSAAAARDIKQLIDATVAETGVGAQVAAEAGSTMQEIVGSAQRIRGLLAEVASATQEQTTGIGHVNGTIVELDRMTQQNATLVEETSAASGQLNDQARRLADGVAVFRLTAA